MLRRESKSLESSPRAILLPTRQNAEAYPANIGLVEAAFITIRAGLMIYGLSQNYTPKETKLEDYKKMRNDYSFALTDIVALDDGFVLSRVTKSNLVDYSHRLKFPNVTKEPRTVNYRREAYNVDSQCITPQHLDLTGDKEIGGNSEALLEILVFERDIIYGALTNWDGYAGPKMPS